MDAIPVSVTLVPQNPDNEKVTAHSVQRGQFSGFPLTKLPNEVLVNYPALYVLTGCSCLLPGQQKFQGHD